MTELRRAGHIFFFIEDFPFVDVPQLLRGQITPTTIKQVFAVSLITREEVPITEDEFNVLAAVPADSWIDEKEISNGDPRIGESINKLLSHGLLLSDSPESSSERMRKIDEVLATDQWNKYAAVYHFMNKWENVNVDAHFPVDPKEWEEYNENIDSVYKAFIDLYGKPPDEFVTIGGKSKEFELPLVDREDGLFGVLEKRRTTRAFDRTTPLSVENLSLILYAVFGCHGTADVFDDIVALKKTSPSGGSLHPTEVYVLILNVEGMDPGIYHYSVKNHSLVLMNRLERSVAEDWANEFTAGQSYPRYAQALFIMTSRFYRSFWKYRKHPKAYGVLLMDAAHLSQTFYLVCAELGLGAFVTAAINGRNVEERLALDGFREGAIAICGCGFPAERNVIDPKFRRYNPRRA